MDPLFWQRELAIERNDAFEQVYKSTAYNAELLGITNTQIHFDSLVIALVDIINKYPDLPPPESVETKILLTYPVGKPFLSIGGFVGLLLTEELIDPCWMTIV
jgi:hypothetical protein